MTGIFNIKNAFQIKDRNFFILGELISGKIKEGTMVDLSALGIEKKIQIENIEFVLQCEDGKASEDIALGFVNLTDAEKDLIKSQAIFSTLINIE